MQGSLTDWQGKLRVTDVVGDTLRILVRRPLLALVAPAAALAIAGVAAQQLDVVWHLASFTERPGADAWSGVGAWTSAAHLVLATPVLAFVWALLSGHWRDADALQNHASAVGGLVVGGLAAAPFAGLIAKRVPRRVLTYAVGGLLLVLAGFQGLQLAGVLA